MSKSNGRPFIDPEFLHQIHPSALLHWLAPARDYLATKGVEIPPPDGKVDYQGLVNAFMAADSAMPEYLLESFYLIQGMATEEGKADILS